MKEPLGGYQRQAKTCPTGCSYYGAPERIPSIMGARSPTHSLQLRCKRSNLTRRSTNSFVSRYSKQWTQRGSKYVIACWCTLWLKSAFRSTGYAILTGPRVKSRLQSFILSSWSHHAHCTPLSSVLESAKRRSVLESIFRLKYKPSLHLTRTNSSRLEIGLSSNSG